MLVLRRNEPNDADQKRDGKGYRVSVRVIRRGK